MIALSYISGRFVYRLMAVAFVIAFACLFARADAGDSLPFVLTKGKWSVFSQQANRFTAIVNGPEGETWLGTPIGIKRVTARGTRFYTTLDGLPAGPVVALARRAGASKEIWCAVISGALTEGYSSSTLTPHVMIVSRFDAARNRWIALSPLHFSDKVPIKDALTQSASAPRILLSVSGTGEAFVALGDAGLNWRDRFFSNARKSAPKTLFRFDNTKRHWEGIALPGDKPITPLITMMQSASDRGIFIGTTEGLFQWEKQAGWKPILRNEPVRAGIQLPNGYWWLVVWQPWADNIATPQLLEIDGTGKVLRCRVFPTLPQPESEAQEQFSSNPPLAKLPPRSGYEWLQDIVLAVSKETHPDVWAVCARTDSNFGHTFTTSYPLYIIRFDADSEKAASDIRLVQSDADLKDIPDRVLTPFLLRGAMGSAIALGINQNTDVFRAICDRFSTYFATGESSISPPKIPYVASRYVGEAGMDADGATWDRGQDQQDQPGFLVRRDTKGNQERFALPTIHLPAFADLAGVAMTASRMLLTLTRDSLLRYAGGAESWQNIPVPDNRGLWLRYGYATRLAVHGDDIWLATDGFAAHYNAKEPEMPLPIFRAESGSAIRLLGVRRDGMAWISTTESEVVLVDAAGKAIRSVHVLPVPEGLSSLTPFHEVGGVMGDTFWFVGSRKLAEGNIRTVLVGYNSRTEKWTLPLECDRVTALRSGEEGSADKPSERVQALVEDRSQTSLHMRVYQWIPKTDRWESVGPALPKEASIASLSLRIVHASPNDLWIVDRNRIRLYHWEVNAKEWSVHSAPSGAGISAGNTIAEAGLYTPRTIDGADTPAIYIAGITGLWEYRIASNAWKHIAVPTIGTWWVFRVADGGSEAAWAILMHPATGTFAAARFDKKQHQWKIYSEAEGFPRKDASDYTLVPDAVDPAHSCWLITRQRLYRMDAKEYWRDRTTEVTGGDPAIATSRIIATPSGDAWLMMNAAIQQVAVSEQRSPQKEAPVAVYWDRKMDTFTRHRPAMIPSGAPVYSTDILLESDGNAVLGTTRGAYRWKARFREWTRLEVPAFSEMPVSRIVRDKNGLWLFGETATACLRP